MPNGDRNDAVKLWLFPAAAALLGAWMAPLFYNAGKALAEVSGAKPTNGSLEWLAERCRQAGFPEFYLAALIVAGLLLLLPWFEWLGAGRRTAARRGPGPWRLPLNEGRAPATRGQALRLYPRGLWHLCAGFLLAAGLTLPLGLSLVPAGVASMRQAGVNFGNLLSTLLPMALLLGVLQEFFFRGVAMGIFLRAMKPAAAIGVSALYFAAVLSLPPPPGMDVADPEAAGTGWEMLGSTLVHIASGGGFAGRFLPLLALGVLLSFARWRTASLWLPIGLQTGWLFARAALDRLVVPDSAPRPGGFEILANGVVPLVAIAAAGFLCHLLTSRPGHERPVGT